MEHQIRYQIFVSSTYEDLRKERQEATQAILEIGGFPSAMEFFPASDATQWELIKRVIEEVDYYVVILGGKYGSIGPEDLSYTEMEYDYAIEIGVPVLGFVKTDIEELPHKFVENDQEKIKKLDAFRAKVQSRTCRMFKDPKELGMAVMKSLMHEARVRPRTGWIRADQGKSDADRKREKALIDELNASKEDIKRLEREVRDRIVLSDELPREQISQGEETFTFQITFNNNEKKLCRSDIEVSWDEIFRTIGPSMYGYIQRKGIRTYNHEGGYGFKNDLIEILRFHVIDDAGGRKINLSNSQIDTCVLQFKELGLIEYNEEENEDGSVFRGITLTELGERHLTRTSVQTKT